MKSRMIPLLLITLLLAACTMRITRHEETIPAANMTPTPTLTLAPTGIQQPTATPTRPTGTPEPAPTLVPSTKAPAPPSYTLPPRATRELPPATLAPAPSSPPARETVTATQDAVKLSGLLLIDSAAGRIYAPGKVREKPQTLVLSTTDGRLLATYDVTGTLALDSVHG